MESVIVTGDRVEEMLAKPIASTDKCCLLETTAQKTTLSQVSL
jgi:hypothetical protein